MGRFSCNVFQNQRGFSVQIGVLERRERQTEKICVNESAVGVTVVGDWMWKSGERQHVNQLTESRMDGCVCSRYSDKGGLTLLLK